ncbi:MAG: cobalamin-dependent protein [Desulfobacterales bacterium]|nr:cobalamin-dependent protein [Desulfobacterales bacterium]
MKNTLRICFLLATNPTDVKWHATLAFGYLKAHTERLFPGQIEYHVAQNLKDAVRFHPDILGISSTSQDFEEAIILCEGARTAKVPVVILGGFHITAFPETLPKAADIGVLGEGEITFGEIVSSLEQRDLAAGRSPRSTRDHLLE